GRYIAVLNPGVDIARFADELDRSGRMVGDVFASALSAVVFEGRPIEDDPRIAYLEPDLVLNVTAAIPTGVDRIDADRNLRADIDGSDDRRVDVDIAIIDTGIDPNHPDLNVVGGFNTTSWDSTQWADDHGHGTHVA